MLDYEWGNPSTIMLTGDETSQEPDQNRQIFDHYTQQSFNENLLHHHHQQQQTSTFTQNHFNHHHHHHHHQTTTTTPTHVHSLYDPRAYTSESTYAPPHHSLLSLDPIPVTAAGGSGGGYFMVPKSEEVSRPADFNTRIGLNLGGRTYFSSAEDDFVNRLYRRSRPGEPGSSNSPRCQAEGCNADLSHAKHYHRRHKVCEFHSKAATVIAAGLTQRFCQQCSRFHILSEFDNGKRSCRKRLADHNRRRRKSQQQINQDNQKPQIDNARNSPSDNVTRSPQDSGAQSSSSVTVAVSPPRMSLDCFRQRPYQASASSATSSSLFFSSG